jgi:predicted nucleic acid-binding protein
MTARRGAQRGVEEAPSRAYLTRPPARFTLDTNVLIYAADSASAARQALASSLLQRAALADCLLTLQSVREFFAAVSRKNLLGRANAAVKARTFLETFRMCVEGPTATRAALEAASTGKGSVWDSLLIATAVEAGCSFVISEDMAPGMHPLGARIVRPFAGDRLSHEVETLLPQ